MCMSVTGLNSGSCRPGNCSCSPCCRSGRPSRARGRRAGCRVDALRLEQADEEVRHGVREDRLLVTHRRRVVDHEQEVDLVDRLLRDGRREVDLRRRRLLADGAREAARAAATVSSQRCRPRATSPIDSSTSSRAPSAGHASRPPSAPRVAVNGGPVAGAVSTISRQTSTSATLRRGFGEQDSCPKRPCAFAGDSWRRCAN